MSVALPDFTASFVATRARAAAVLAGQASIKPFAVLATAEFLLLIVVGYGAAIAYFQFTADVWPLARMYLPMVIAIAPVEVAAVSVAVHAADFPSRSREWFAWNGLMAVLGAASAFLSIGYLLRLQQDVPRAVICLQLGCMAATIVGARSFLYPRMRSMLRAGLIEARRVILVGDVGQCLAMASRLRDAGVRTVRLFAITPTVLANPDDLNAVFRTLAENCRGLAAEDILLLTDVPNFTTVADSARQLAELPINVQLVLVGSGGLTSAVSVVRCGDGFALRFFAKPLSVLDCCIKRALDILVSASSLVLLFPLFVLVALVIKLESRGPALFSQRRHGYNNSEIRIYKFRTMTVMEDGNDFRQVTKNDCRVTRVGRLLRQTSIDELPQLYNVLIGNMSIVGPRPHAVAHNAMFCQRIPMFWRRHNIKPGITGWAQVNGCRGETDTTQKMQRRVEFDLQYVDRWSLLFDLKIMLMTVFSKHARLNAY
ncbi:MAG TPA: exopolysaccharide biosynthesis polyprenyl glycosylphosphotransferase [Xanthobacteraceae bacterium]|nr:exopolysaccharide biosynthesis polyprenyl glycosylphosphotransferase [Xanthobacteraceae bacterium]